jgi:gas vesicle protein
MNGLGKLLLAVGAGVAVGAAIGVLYAPAEGRDTRKKIVKKSKKLIGAVNGGLDDGQESLEEIKEVLQKQLNRVSRKLDSLTA